MPEVKILIVENELLTAASMQMTLERAGYAISDSVQSGADALHSVRNNQPDVIIMDIHLDGHMDGISTARAIKKIIPVPLIFITQWQDEDLFRNALEAFPQNYLNKPFAGSALIHAVELALQKAAEEKAITALGQREMVTDSIFIPVNNASVRLLKNDILYLRAKGAYTEIHYEPADKTGEACHMVSLSSNHVVDQLAYPALIKVHRSCFINIHKIDKIQKSSVFIAGTEISVAKEYMTALKNNINIFRH